MTVSRAPVTLLRPNQALALSKIRGIAIQTLVFCIAVCIGGCNAPHSPCGVDEMKISVEIDSFLDSFNSHQLSVKLFRIDKRIADKAAVLLAVKEMRISHEKGRAASLLC